MVTKKGAIEFSMTTIMVVIIGVAVLALGLTWIRSTFEQVGGITEGSLEAAETIVGEVAFSGKASAPAVIRMGSTDAKKFKILVRNTGNAGDEFKVTTVVANHPSSGCLNPATQDLGTILLDANGIGEFAGGITSNNCAGNGDLTATVKKLEDISDPTDDSTYAIETMVIRIE
jgi:hypothetical protein